MRHVITLFCLLLLTVGSVSANQESHRRLAIQLVRIYEKDIDESYDISSEADKLIQQNPALRSYRQPIIRFMQKYLNRNQLKQYLVIAFMREFPEDKLKDIVEFFTSPAGNLWREKSSQFDKTIASIVNSVFAKHKAELMQMIKGK